MSERDSRFQRGLNAIAKGYRNHQGTAIVGSTALTSGIAIELSPAPSPAREITASALIIVGAVTAIASSFADYYNLITDKHLWLDAQNTTPQQPSGFHEEETTIMTAEEIASAMADFKQ